MKGRWIALLSLYGVFKQKIHNDRFLAEHILSPIRRVVLSIFLKKDRASATVEASIVMPIFIFAYLAIMQILWLVVAQLGIVNALFDTGNGMLKTSMLLEDNKTISVAQMAVSFYGSLNKDYLDKSGIVGKAAGISLLESNVKDDLSEIYLKADYVYNNSFDIAGLFFHKYAQTLYFRGWVGCNTLGRRQDVAGTIVYVTDYGQVYHTRRDCAYLNPSIQQRVSNELISIRNASGAKYLPCKSCYSDTYVIYITDYGTAYHSDKNCSGLKRGIMAVDMDKASSVMGPCSKCSQSNK